MIVPDEEKLHWRVVSITIKVPHDHLDLASLTRELGDGNTGLLLEASGSLTSQSHAFFFPSTPREGDDQSSGEHVIQIDSYRFEREEDDDNQTDRLSSSRFFSVLQNSILNVDRLQVISIADLYYPAAQATWRMKMLADPPKLEELQSGIGKMSLSGVKLRFSDSPHGLLESFLEISPDEDEYRCSLTVIDYMSPDQLSSVHATVVKRAEEFAQLFVEVQEGS